MRFLGVKIADGFSSEASVFAALLHPDFADLPGAARIRFDVLYQTSPGDTQGAERFQDAVSPEVVLHSQDFGWRPPLAGRSVGFKVRTHARFYTQLPGALRKVRRLRPDIIYSSQESWDCRVATFLARRLRRPQIIHLHYVIGPWLGTSVLKRLHDCDHVLAVSNFIREEAIRHGVAPDRVTTVYNSVTLPDLNVTPSPANDIRQELGIDASTPLIGMVARIDPQKGQDQAIRAFAEILSEFPDAHLLLVGGALSWHTKYADSLRHLSAVDDLTGRVHLLGHREDVPAILRCLDIFLHPAHNEPFGLAVAEASAAGLPVVGYADGATPELVVSGVTGLLTPHGEGVNGLARSLRILLSDPSIARAMGALGRVRMQVKFSPTGAQESFREALTRVGDRQTPA